MSDPKFDHIGSPETKLMEECAEVIHVACKIQRFGWMNFHPNDALQTPNWQLLLNEIGDLEKRIAETKRFIELHIT